MTPRLLALPGTLCSPAVFDPLAAALTGEVTVEAWSWLTQPGPWDIPSVAARLAARLDRQQAGPSVVCGHSTGGAISLQLAVSRPDLVSGLVLVDTGAHMHGHGDVSAILDRIAHDWGPDLIAAVIDRSFRRPPPDRAALIDWALAVDPAAAYAVLASQRDLDLTARLTAITGPTVVVHGLHDRARPPEQGRELAAALGAELVLVDAGHTPVAECPEEVAAAVRRVVHSGRPAGGRRSAERAEPA